MFTIDGKTLKVGSNTEALNYEMSDVLTILVQSTDSGDILYSVQSTIHIKIMDINDPPTDITLSNNVVCICLNTVYMNLSLCKLCSVKIYR